MRCATYLVIRDVDLFDHFEVRESVLCRPQETTKGTELSLCYMVTQGNRYFVVYDAKNRRRPRRGAAGQPASGKFTRQYQD
jgi:hypothetical protein